MVSLNAVCTAYKQRAPLRGLNDNRQTAAPPVDKKYFLNIDAQYKYYEVVNSTMKERS